MSTTPQRGPGMLTPALYPIPYATATGGQINGAAGPLTLAAGQSATFIQAPWQELPGQLQEPFDLVLCHAVLEWLAEPYSIFPVLRQLTAAEGWLSLAFYNKG